MPTWRLVVHALDRTGPPMLARAFVRWLRGAHPDHDVDVVAFRGGELLDDLLQLCDVRVVLDPLEPWDWRAPDAERLAELEPRLAGLPRADATLLVSVAGGQALPLLPAESCDPIVTWSVEQGEDLHEAADERTARWLAGSTGTRDELRARLGDAAPIELVAEFIETPVAPDDERRRRYRTALGATDDDLLVLGAGIATVRKAPDLFVEAALAHVRRDAGRAARYVWLGGEHDEFFHTVRAEVHRLGLGQVRLVGNVVDVVPYLAAADVFLHPARLDAFPLVCLHAAAVGTPVVAFAGVGGVVEMFGDSFVGSPYPDLTGLVDRLDELADPTRRAEVGDAQRARVLSRYTAEVAAPAILDQLRVAAGMP